LKVAVLGGSAGGMFASLLLARAGHEVVLVDQDGLELAPDVESAARSALRASAPQIVHPHYLVAKCRELLSEGLPDVFEALLAAGASPVPLTMRMPVTLSDRSSQPGDERLATLATRRSTLDWVLQRFVSSEPRVTIRPGIKVVGLLARPGHPPHVVGVRTSSGGEIAADVVVDACGRRSAIQAWLDAIGARAPTTWQAECGLAYFTRHHRVRPGAELPAPSTSRLLATMDEFTALISGADNGIMQLAVIPLATDRRFRNLRNPEVHTAVLRSVPAFASWLDGLEPITDVYVMAGLHNTMRRLVVDGTPVATGLAAIGDSVCSTNPTLARGLALAVRGALDLVKVIEEHPEDWTAQALHVDALIGEHVYPFYTDQAVIDGERLATLRHNIDGAPAPEPRPPITDRVTFTQLHAAAMFDPTAFRGLWEVMGMTRTPEEIYCDPQIVVSTRETLEQHHGPPVLQPTPQELHAALAV
jgi:2-polyprenyl-6-methoxyphenol hydroxylase-like FAD-dependent oxidoreductase